MNRRLTFFALIAVAALADTEAGRASQVQKLGKCYAPLAEILTKGGFSSGIDCTDGWVKTKLVGRIGTKAGYIAVYDRYYRTNPVAPGAAYHGGQRILLIENGKTYLGQYGKIFPLLKNLSIRDNAIVAASDPKVRIGLEDGHPPQSILIDGDLYDFAK